MHPKLLFIITIATSISLLLLADPLMAQTLTTLHSFLYPANTDGQNPQNGVIASGGKLYGTTLYAETNYPIGPALSGAVFSINTDGSGYTVLYYFSPISVAGTNRDGGAPYDKLLLSGNTLYGTTFSGGTEGYGTIFALNTNGSGFTVLHNFTNDFGGGNPYGDLLVSNNTLYGTTFGEGGTNNGTVFAINTDGSGFRILHSFSMTTFSGAANTNGDGVLPRGGLVLSDGTLYGTTTYGGNFGSGTVFALSTNGSNFVMLHSFLGSSDGYAPYDSLLLSGNRLYGTATSGGASGVGTVFALNTDGSQFSVLHTFTQPNYGQNGFGINSDGAQPQCWLILSGDTLYGTTSDGGPNGNGTVFAVNTNGNNFVVLYNFTSQDMYSSTNTDGAHARGGLAFAGNTLYGTAVAGGDSDDGTVFALALPSAPTLSVVLSGDQVVLTWSTNAVDFTLQTSISLTPPVAWSNVLTMPFVANGLNIVTNSLLGKQQFFRLAMP